MLVVPFYSHFGGMTKVYGGMWGRDPATPRPLVLNLRIKNKPFRSSIVDAAGREQQPEPENHQAFLDK